MSHPFQRPWFNHLNTTRSAPTTMFLLHIVFHPPFSSFPLDPHILLGTLFPNTFQVPFPHVSLCHDAAHDD